MKRAKKTLAVLLMTILMVMSFGIVASADTVPVGTWSVNIVVNGTSHTFTSADAAKLTAYTVTASYVNKANTTVSNSYTGVKFKDVLKSIGVTDVQSVSAKGTDGYAMSPDYTEAIAMNDNTLIAWGMNNAAMDASHGPVMLIPGGSGTQSGQFLKAAGTITVTGATLEKTTTTTTPTTTTTTTTTTSSTSSNPKTGDSSPISMEVILLMAAAILAVSTTIGLRKSFSHK